MLMNRLYHIVEWKATNPKVLFTPRNGMICKDVDTGEENFIITPKQSKDVYTKDGFVNLDDSSDDDPVVKKDVKKAKAKDDDYKKGNGIAADKENENYKKSVKSKIVRKELNPKEIKSRNKFVADKVLKRMDAREKRRITEELNIIPEKLKGIKWSAKEVRKDVNEEEKIDTYEWAKNMDGIIDGLEDNVKIITLYKRWKTVLDDDSNKGSHCRNLIQGKAISVAYEQKNYDLMHAVAINAVNHESANLFYRLTELFSRTRKGNGSNFKDNWRILNRENGLITCEEILEKKHKDLFVHMYESCRIMNSKLTRLGDVVKDVKDKNKEKWISKYQGLIRKFHDEEYEQVNREARDFICEMNSRNIKETSLNIEVYIIGIDASIKAGNPDLALLEDALRIADNDPCIMLRSLAIKIKELEVNRLNDIRVNEVLDDICLTGKEIEQKIYENMKHKKDICKFHEDRDYLEECYEQFSNLLMKQERRDFS
jgi:hypothetical protein